MRRLVSHTALLMMLASTTAAQDSEPSYTIFGTPGLLEMPTAESAAPDDIVTTIARSPSGRAIAFGFMLLPAH